MVRPLVLLAVSLGLCSPAVAAERSGLVHRASCTLVRYYVAKYTATAAESWARNNGATEAEIDAARRCLKDAPAQTAMVSRSAVGQ